MTRQPADWVFTARIRTAGVRRPIDRPWRKIAKAIHGHGIPAITVDPVSTPFEIACQVVLKGYWHGHIGRDEPALANAVAMAYPSRSSAFSPLPMLRTVCLPPRRCSNNLSSPDSTLPKGPRQPAG